MSKAFFYSSPYQYYADNLIPLAKYFREKGWATEEIYRLDNKKFDGSDILKRIKKSDVVFLVQSWWYFDAEIAAYCVKYKVPFYIVDHAPIVIKYIDRAGKKSHLYRANLCGAQAIFVAGESTKRVMREVGCKEKVHIVGSTRFDEMSSLYKRNEKKNFVLFDTSAKMEDKSCLEVIRKFAEEHQDEYHFVLREHSRSSKLYRELGFELDHSPEIESLNSAAACGFTFPSSAMAIPLEKGMPIAMFYAEHFSEDVMAYRKRYGGDMKNIWLAHECRSRMRVDIWCDTSAALRIFEVVNGTF